MELDIQKLAEELIARLQKQSRVYVEQGEKSKWMAEGARELYDVIRREAQLSAERLQPAVPQDSVESPSNSTGDVGGGTNNGVGD